MTPAPLLRPTSSFTSTTARRASWFWKRRERIVTAPLAGSIAALLLWSASVEAQTYTAASGLNFSNATAWNFGAGAFGTWSLPVSDPALTLNFLTGNLTAINDLNLTLNRMNFHSVSSGSTILNTALGGTFAFTDAAGISLRGSGASAVIGGPVVLASGATGLTFDGAGGQLGQVSGVISSNTSTGAPLIIATTARNAGTGQVALSGANTFAGGVVLNSGTLALVSARSLGDRVNVLTINGGRLRGALAASPVTVANQVALNGTLIFDCVNVLTLRGVVNGTGAGVTARPSTTAGALQLSAANTYTGATFLGAPDFAQAAVDGAGTLSINNAGSILGTSGITISGGATLNVDSSGTYSAGNSRISAATAITSQGGFLATVGNAGLVRQSFGTVNAGLAAQGGLTTISALANGAVGSPATGSGVEVTVGNLVRGTGATVVFQGVNLGANAVTGGLPAAQGNVLLTQVNGAAPAAALVGGGGAAGTQTVSILPWALGEASTNTLTQYNLGSGFVTTDTNGVRLLNPATEYNTGNNFTTAGATQNVRVTSAITSHAAPATVNSLFFASTGRTLAGGVNNALTITSGALASNVAVAAISNPVLFGPGGAGEAVISVVDALAGATNTLTLSGGFTAASLTKSGHGDLTLATTNPTLTGPIRINGGEIKVASTALLGTPSSITINGQSQAASRAGLSFTHTTGSQPLSVPIATTGSAATITTASGGTLALNSTISGSGSVTYGGLGTVTIGGTNSYTGGTFLSGAGTVSFANDAAFGSSADPAASFLGLGGGVANVTGTWTSARNIAVTGSITLNTTANPVTLSGAITGTSNVTRTGSNTLTITGGDSPYSGTIILGTAAIAGGTLALSGSGALNSASITFGASAGPAGTYALDLSGAADTDPTDGTSTPWRSINALTTGTGFTRAHSIQLGSTVGAPVDLRVASGTFGLSTAAGVIQGFGKLVKTGTGTLTLSSSAASTFTGGVEVWGGTLSFSADNQLGAASNTITLAGGALNTGSSLVSARNFILKDTPQPIISGSTIVILNNSLVGSATLNGNVTGGGGFTKPSGSVTLAGTNTYGGDTQITLGATVAFGSNANLGGSTSRIRLNGGTLQDTATTGTQTVPRTIITTANSTVSVAAGGALELSGPIAGANIITKTSAGSLLISGSSPSFFGGITVGNGSPAGNFTLTGQLRRATVNLFTSAASTFDMSGLTRELGALSSSANGFAAGNTVALGSGGALIVGFNNPANMTWAGRITGDAAAAVTKVGTGSLTITSNTHTFGGGFHLLSGNAAFSTAGTLPAQTAFTLGGWGTTANAGPRFLIDNSGTNVTPRIADAQIIHSNSGELSYAGFSTASTETIGSLRGAGMSTVTFNPGGALAFAAAANGLTRLDRGTFLFRSASGNLGTGATTAALPNLTFANLPGTQLIGGGGAAGGTTISILPYAVSGVGTSDSGRDFVTYGANGIRALNTGTEVQANLLAAGATENVRMANASLTTSSLATDRTINSLNINGTAKTTRIDSLAAQKLTITSGAVLNVVPNVWTTNGALPGGVPLGLQMSELQTGAGNTRELNVFTTSADSGVTPADLALGAKITTTGGLTKSGMAALYLTNPANSYSGDTTINAGSLVIDDKAALGASTNLVIGGGFLKYRGGDATLSGFTVKTAGGSAAGLGASAGFHVVSGSTLTLAAGSVSGNGGILKDGTGVLTLTGTNTNSGATIISGGALAIGGPAALGTNGRVIFGTGLSTSGGQTLRFDAPMTLTQDFITNTSDAGIGIGFDTNGNDVTLSGTILSTVSTRGLYKFGTGELNLTATEMYTGATQIFGGTLRLSGANGSVHSSTGSSGFDATATVAIYPGAALVLDNAAANNNNRLPDVWDTPFGTGNDGSGALNMAGGELKIIGNAAGTLEKVNQVNLSTGTVTLSGGGTQLVSGGLVRNPNAGVGLIRGTNLGGTPGPGSTNWFLTDLGSGSTQLGGAGGAKGTPYVNILPGFMADTSATGSGTDLVTYSADVGFRPLDASEYSGAILPNISDVSRAPIVSLTGAATVNETTAITALKLGAGASLAGGGTLQLGQGTILATGTSAISVPMLNANISGGNSGLYLLTSGSGTVLTIGSALAGGTLFKSGDGTLLINGRYLSPNFFATAMGTTIVGASARLNPVSLGVLAQTGATVDFSAADQIIPGLSFTNLVGSSFLGTVQDGTVLLGASRLTLYNSGSSYSFTGGITGAGGLTKALFSSGVATFTQPLAYTGSTVIHAGSVSLGGAATLASTAIALRGGSLIFTNTDDVAGAGGYIANRIGASVPITLGGGGISFTENVNAPANHNLGPIDLVGGGTIAISQTSVTAPSTTTIANLVRTTGTLTLAAGSNLGFAQAANGNARIIATQINGSAPTTALVGGGGAAGTTTVSIIPWAWNQPTGSFVTYDATNGFRALAAAEQNTAFGGSTTDNVGLANSATLAAPTTANSLAISGGTGVSGAFDLTLGSGALTSSSITAVSIGNVGTTNKLKTDAAGGNTRELVVNTTGAAVAITLNDQVGTTAGLTKFGAGALTLANSGNTFSGGIRINEGLLNYSADSQLGDVTNGITFGINTTALTARGLQLTGTGAGSTTTLSRDLTLNGFGAVTAPSNTVYRLTGAISGPGALAFSQSTSQRPVYELSGTNTATGDVQLIAGLLSFSSDAALGSGSTLLIGSLSVTDGVILRGDWTTGRNVHIRATPSINTNGHTATLSGQLFGTAALAKQGLGALILTEPMPYNAAFTINAGEVRLKDRGSLAADGNALSVSANATLTLDDSAAHFSDRLHDSSGGVTLNGGSFNLLGNGAATTEEVINTLALGAGANVVSIVPGAGQAATLRLSNGAPTNAAGAATLFRGNNLGVNAPGTANSASIVFTSAASQTLGFPVVGGGATAGNPSLSIIKGGFGDTTNTGLGTQLVTYDYDKGVRLLTASEFTGTLADGSVVTDNIQLTGSKNLTAPTTANALWLDGGGSTTGTGTLTLTAATILATGTGNSIATPLATAANALAIGGPGDVTINGAISGSAGLIKMGAGTLTLGAASGSLSGNSWLQSGTVAAANAGAFGGSTVHFVDATLSNASSPASALTLANAVQVDGIARIGGAQDLTLSGNVMLNSATREFNITNTATTTIGGVIDGTADLAGIGIVKTGPGLLVLTGANLYGNTTGINRFYESYTDVNDGELRVNNASGSGTGGSIVRVNIGGTLSGTGTVGTLNVPGGIVAPGAAGAGTLKSGDTTFAGGTFALELSSAALADQLSVTGTVSLTANTALTLSLIGGYVPTVGDSWTIIANDGSDAVATGAFRFTNAGSPIAPLTPFTAGGNEYVLNYAGGTGNDVILEVVPEPGTTALLGGALGLLGFARRRKR